MNNDTITPRFILAGVMFIASMVFFVNLNLTSIYKLLDERLPKPAAAAPEKP